MTDLFSPLSVHIGGIHFRGYNDRQDHGFWVAKDGWEGWENPPAQRSELVNRANAHGVFDALQFFDAREVTQRGFFRARSRAQLANMQKQLAGLLDGSTRRISVEYGGEVEWADCRRGLAEPMIETTSNGDLHVGEYEIVHRMADPRKYGELNEFTGTTVQVYHRGNFPALPKITVTGSLPSGYQVASQGLQFNVSQALTSGQTHVIDMATGWLYRNGTLQTGAVATAEVFTIPPGKQTPVVFTPASGSGQMTVRFHDTSV